MGKMSELAEQLTELRHCGEILIGISETLTEMFSTPTPIRESVQPKKEYTFEEVRAILATKSREGHTDEVKEIITALGAEKLSDIKPEQYDELLKKVEVL